DLLFVLQKHKAVVTEMWRECTLLSMMISQFLWRIRQLPFFVQNREPTHLIGGFANFSFFAATDERFVKAISPLWIKILNPASSLAEHASGLFGVVWHQ